MEITIGEEQEQNTIDPYNGLASVDDFPDLLQVQERSTISEWVQILDSISQLLASPEINIHQTRETLKEIGREFIQTSFDTEYTAGDGYQMANPSSVRRYNGTHPNDLWNSLGYVGVSRERAKLAIQISEIVESSLEKLGLEQNPFTGILRGLDRLQELHDGFPKAEEIFLHSADAPIAAELVVNGAVASKKAQLEHFGKAQFATGSAVIEKQNDKYLVTNNSTGHSWLMTPEELHQHRAASKNLMQEAYDVCFNTDSVYFAQTHGIHFIFNKAQILANNQFMEADGLHVYANDYNDKPDSPGLFIPFDDYDYAVVVDSVTEPRFIVSLLELVDAGKIKEEALVDWYAKNVMRVENRNAIESIRESFFRTHPQTVEKGTFLPTTNKGETPSRLNSAKLIKYQVESERPHQIQDQELTLRTKVRELFENMRVEAQRKKDEAAALLEYLDEVPW